MKMRAALVFVSIVACGGSERHSATPSTNSGSAAGPRAASSSAPSAASPAAKEDHTIPGGCAAGSTAPGIHAVPPGGGSGGPCVPDAKFARRLCNGSFPDVALLLMSKSMPFTHAFLKGDVDGWNAEGGASARAKLKFDEDVLILWKRSSDGGGMQVSGGGGYQVMRWDGNCYTLSEGELTMHRPPAPKSAPIVWRYLEEPTKNSLLEDAHVKAAYDKRNHECKGAVSGDVTLACQKADEALSSAVAAAVREGVTVPTPQKTP